MSDAPRLLLDHHLKTLKLPTFLREYDKLARQCAAESLDHVRFLARLVELELIDRERRMIERRIKAATAGIFVAATLGSTVALKGSSPPAHHDPAPAPVEHSQAR